MCLVLDLRIVHDRSGSRSDPSLNGHLHYPNDIDKSLNESVTDKIRKYRSDYNNNPKSRVGLTLTKTGTLRIILNIDGVFITSKSHTHPSHS